jgi:hypothetical protein
MTSRFGRYASRFRNLPPVGLGQHRLMASDRARTEPG